MNTLLVSYELQGGGDYSAVRTKLTSGASWWHHLDSVWLVITDQGCDDYEKELSAVLQPGDKLLVIDVTAVTTRWNGFDDDASNWIKESP